MSTPTTTRTRVNITSTIKDGYRVGDATVEFVWDGLPPTDSFDITTAELVRLIRAGEYAAAKMNAEGRHEAG